MLTQVLGVILKCIVLSRNHPLSFTLNPCKCVCFLHEIYAQPRPEYPGLRTVRFEGAGQFDGTD